MPRALNMTLFVLAPLVLLLAVAVFLLSRVDTRSEFETVASNATGLEVAVKGKVSIGLFPMPHATLMDVALKNKESKIVSANEADVGVEFWPLLRKEVHIKRLALQNVSIDVVRDRKGHYNFVHTFENRTARTSAEPRARVGGQGDPPLHQSRDRRRTEGDRLQV